MAKPGTFPHERARAYRMQLIVTRCVHRITRELPDREDSLAGILQRAGLTLMLKIVRGCQDRARTEARRHFREAGRAAQLCQSCVLGLGQMGIGRPRDRERAIHFLQAIRSELGGLVAGIDSGLSRKDIGRRG